MSFALFTFFFAGALAAPAYAAPIVFNLNCALGPGANNLSCPALPGGATSAGTVTLTDDGNEVIALVSLLDGSQDVQGLWLNYGTGTFADTLFVGDIEDANKQQADGYTGGKFDLELTSKASQNPFSFTLALTSGGNLDPTDFLFKDTQGLFYVGVKGKAGGDFYGSAVLQTTDTPPDSTQLPEPATLLMFGMGSVVFARLRGRGLKSRA